MRRLPWLTAVPVAAMTALLLSSLLAPTATTSMALTVALIGAALGIPHGAVDHLIPWWWSSRTPGSTRSLAVFAALYAATATVAITAFLRAPTPTLVVFLLLSAVHFGRGEVVTSAERAARQLPRATDDWPATSAYGLVVVGLLLWWRPAQTDTLLRPLSPWLADAAVNSRTAGLVVVAVAVTAGLSSLVRARRLGEAAELVLLTATFVLAPPLAAFGIYFGLWHSVRHTGRLLDLAHGRLCPGGRDGSWPAAARLLARSAALPTAAAMAAVGVLWTARDLAGLQAEVAVLLALTFPHAGVVWALDRRAGHRSWPRKPRIAPIR